MSPAVSLTRSTRPRPVKPYRRMKRDFLRPTWPDRNRGPRRRCSRAGHCPRHGILATPLRLWWMCMVAGDASHPTPATENPVARQFGGVCRWGWFFASSLRLSYVGLTTGTLVGNDHYEHLFEEKEEMLYCGHQESRKATAKLQEIGD
ncbi:uncharacterized protein LOC123446235 isoform X2 [Hordeum vulgare subsp. vulgare]|uniref:uncharacterized protein LOC123446235 isoform X2 n=1 Tax=Hordeum vulgare subsp. vulgare TaxID=112509 RepID=UPI001D1A3FE9|nr:uncharacterized protein LOC123446235 isoform X2 [Hordeum vulgare subsp. vulgare]